MDLGVDPGRTAGQRSAILGASKTGAEGTPILACSPGTGQHAAHPSDVGRARLREDVRMDGRGSERTVNIVTGDVSGTLVQAGSISGGVHLHLTSQRPSSPR